MCGWLRTPWDPQRHMGQGRHPLTGLQVGARAFCTVGSAICSRASCRSFLRTELLSWSYCCRQRSTHSSAGPHTSHSGPRAQRPALSRMDSTPSACLSHRHSTAICLGHQNRVRQERACLPSPYPSRAHGIQPLSVVPVSRQQVSGSDHFRGEESKWAPLYGTLPTLMQAPLHSALSTPGQRQAAVHDASPPGRMGTHPCTGTGVEG